MPIRPEYTPPQAALEFLVRCYRFVAWEWPHAERVQVPDQGFEQRFRESCFHGLTNWSVSTEREFHLGIGIDTASGVAHEVDIVARHPDLIAIMEMKNRGGVLPGKNDVIVFFAKVLDTWLLIPLSCPVTYALRLCRGGPLILAASLLAWVSGSTRSLQTYGPCLYS